MADEDRVRDFWRRVWTLGEVEFAHEFFSSPYVENDRQRTPDSHAQGAAAFRRHFPDFRVEVTRVLTGEDFVVSRVVYRGTYAGGWPGVTTVGTEVTVTGLDLFRFEEGMVVEHLHEADHELLWEQLGVSLPPG